MPGRYEGLKATIEGYKRTGVDLVVYNDPISLGDVNTIGPAGLTDNLGTYYFIPKFVQLTGIDLDLAIQLFYTGFTFVAFILSTLFMWKLCKTGIGKIISVFALTAISLIIAGIGDYYIYAGALPLGAIPIWIHLYKSGNHRNIFIFILSFGFIASLVHLMRSHAGTAVVLIILTMIFISKEFTIKDKFKSLVLMFLPYIIISATFNNIVEKRNNYLESINSVYDLSGTRAMWHNMYYSLGFLNNYYGENGYKDHEASDTYALKKVLSINPDVIKYGVEYEQILKNEYFKFVKAHPLFFMKTVFSKIGVLLMYFILFSNIGLILSFYYKPSRDIVIISVIGLCFNALFGLIALPEYQYLCGFFVFATLFNLFNFDQYFSIYPIKSYYRKNCE